MPKCKHPITNVSHLALGPVDMGVQIMCVDCGAATSYLGSFKAAREAWEEGRTSTNEALAAVAESIRKLKRLSEDQVLAQHPELGARYREEAVHGG